VYACTRTVRAWTRAVLTPARRASRIDTLTLFELTESLPSFSRSSGPGATERRLGVPPGTLGLPRRETAGPGREDDDGGDGGGAGMDALYP
jgi:hypothetical protein